MNIKEIAGRAGVSVATVSRVLNHPEHVAEKTREHVLSLIEEMGYKPNWFARGLNSNRTYTIGLMIPNLLNPAYVEMAKGVEEIASKRGYTTLLCVTVGDPQKERKHVQTLMDRRVDGMLLVSSALEDDDIFRIKERGISIVLVGENKGNSKEPTVRIDCGEAAANAARHLLSCGYREIAMVYGKSPETENQNKICGFQRALQEASVAIPEEYLVCEKNTIEGGAAAARKLFELSSPPRAIFTSSDLLALGVMEAARETGRSIPKDLALVGFDNIRIAELMEPRLSTVAKPLRRMGIYGTKLLFNVMENIDDASKKREIVLKSKLKIRKSCGGGEKTP